ncbi:MAG: SANT/Myb-like DNA-binding domain-containing protein [archaeon]|nr:SANT/Myb-like DNA-binding domain-containing protein [archaeon]
MSFSLSEASTKFNKGYWTSEEDLKLRTLIEKYKEGNWKLISLEIKTRSPLQCLQRWTKVLRPGRTKGPWTKKENDLLINFVKQNGPCNFSECEKIIKGRTAKQIREHWQYTLSPEIIKGEWTEEEEFKIFFYFKKFKGCWKKISQKFNGRPDNSIKNRFYCLLRRIAKDKLNIEDKRIINKLKLETLSKYAEEAFSLYEEKFKNKIGEEEFKKYLTWIGMDEELKEEEEGGVKEGIDLIPINNRLNNGSVCSNCSNASKDKLILTPPNETQFLSSNLTSKDFSSKASINSLEAMESGIESSLDLSRELNLKLSQLKNNPLEMPNTSNNNFASNFDSELNDIFGENLKSLDSLDSFGFENKNLFESKEDTFNFNFDFRNKESSSSFGGFPLASNKSEEDFNSFNEDEGGFNWNGIFSNNEEDNFTSDAEKKRKYEELYKKLISLQIEMNEVKKEMESLL